MAECLVYIDYFEYCESYNLCYKLSSSTCLIRFCWHCMFGCEGGCKSFFFQDMIIISHRNASSLSFSLIEI